MSNFSKIIIGNIPDSRLFFSPEGEDGQLLNLAIKSRLKAMVDSLNGFAYVKIGESKSEIYFNLRQYGKKKIIRIKDKLGMGAIDDEKTISLDGVKAEVLVIHYEDNQKTDKVNTSEYIDAVKKAADKNTKIIYIMINNSREDELLEYLSANHLENLTVITNATVLRDRGLDISKGLSWESTINDLVWQINTSENLCDVFSNGSLIVRFESEGAIAFSKDFDENTAEFIFISDKIEGDLFRQEQGYMIGYDIEFAYPIIKAVCENTDLKEAVKDGMLWADGFYANGYLVDGNAVSIDNELKDDDTVDYDNITLDFNSIEIGYGKQWSLLEYNKDISFEKLAINVVREGMKALDKIPSARIKYFVTIDKNEIERFRAVNNLMEEYLNTKTVKRPLSIAVFGQPGSGKSFGVEQIASALGGDQIKILTYNLSQMRSEEELNCTFHDLQDLCLKDKVPLVFFDEFDSADLSWLKCFLAPMQDAAFNQNGLHFIGRCIFVFAGGIFETFDDFCAIQDEDFAKKAKVRDFISRLRGYINIKGPNPNPTISADTAYCIRRAVVLRSLIECKAGWLIDEKSKEALIDEDIIRTLLKIPMYQHGIRSIEAIIDMSMLADKKYWRKSDLPPADQLSIHISDKDMFKKLIILFTQYKSYREDMANAIHEDYLAYMDEKRKKDKTHEKKPNEISWNELSEHFKDDNRNQADDNVLKLFDIGCTIQPTEMQTEDFAFTKEEVEYLSEKEHERWIKNKIATGWTQGKERNDEKKIHTCLLPWDELPEKEKDKDRNAIMKMPDVLSRVGLIINRIK